MKSKEYNTRLKPPSNQRHGHLAPVDDEYRAQGKAKNDDLARTAASRAICRYLKVSVWESDDMYALPARGQSRLVFLYLLTGPHTLSLHVPGLYSIGPQALKERLSMSGQQFTQAVATLQSAVGLRTDYARCLIWMPSALQHMGPPANPNIVRSYCRGLQLAPKSELREEAIRAYAPFLASLGDHLLKPFAECFPTVCQTLWEPFRIEREREIEKVKEEEKDDVSSQPHEDLKSSLGCSQGDGSKANYEAGLRHVKDILESIG